MTDQIVTREHWRTTGAAAFAAGRGRDDHDMNPGSDAIVEWQAGWDRLKSERANDCALEARRAIRMARSIRSLHDELASAARVDARQVNGGTA